ncbi:dihydropyrimidine dehydrogenase subunit A [Deferribacter autotrophicus]|uniref:Dihydropyrimidine dehydrogenase subunit A n=1 Tax=Deferribacter autotrophicus TaxID=500465 RepID=A0A5A8F6I2_9BACT|nr:FAD-dependent oxidoreductase [Deferribacter autotrophicus]KAA0259210.1 dihydropyrimidine dehydrogenase subunit A [Deferribacter autotrophicus]
MAKVYYGFWKDQIIDNRNKPYEEWTDAPLKIDDEFNGKKLKVFVNWNGFLVFDKDVDLLDVLTKYMYEISGFGCCGRCFPGRMGTRILAEQLQKIKNDGFKEEDIKLAYDIAYSIYVSAKCTVAPTATVPVRQFLKNFMEEEFKGVIQGENSKELEYVKHLTAPCTAGCPANVKIPEFIEAIKDHRFLEALKIIRTTMPLPGVCGRVCPHPCEANCRRGLVDDPVNIMVLKRTPWDYEYYHHKEPDIEKIRDEETGKKVAIVGAGPAGLTAAYYLALMGHQVKIYEMLPEPGGMVAVGIPDYRQPRHLLRREVEIVQSLGVEIQYNTKLGKDIFLKDLKEQYDAVLLAIGAFKSRDMGVEGEKDGYKGVMDSGIGFLRRVSLGEPVEIGDRVVVVGGGNTAIDCVRTALRLGSSDVNLVYRRSRAEMPAEDYEVVDAEEEGVKFHFLCNPVKLIAEDGKLVGVECVRMKLGEPDESGRRRPEPIPGSNFVIECDTIIPAIGQFPDLSFLSEEDGIQVTRWNTIAVKEDLYMTDVPGIFAAGDCEWGPATVVKAIGAARWAAKMIDRYLMEGEPYLTDEEKLELTLYKNKVFEKDERIQETHTIPRVHQEKLPPEVRVRNFEEIEKPYTENQAYLEATRCLRCIRMAMVGLDK